MSKSLIFLGVLVFLVSCGKKDTIKTHVQTEMLGDGENIPQSLVLPLSDKTVASYDGSMKGVPSIFKGLVGTVMNLGASLGAGKQRLTLIQPIPEIPDRISAISIKRIFFIIDSPEGDRVDFKFLRSLAVKVSAATVERNDDSWEPIIETGSLDKKERSAFLGMLRDKWEDRKKDTLEQWEMKSKGLMLLRYSEDAKKESLVQNKGKMYSIETTDPYWAMDYFNSQYSDLIQRSVILNKTLLVEVNPNAADLALFKERLRTDPTKFNKLNKQAQICDEDCLDFKLLDFNLIPLLQSGNALKIDAYIDPQKAPKSFQLKGFVEFNFKIKAKM